MFSRSTPSNYSIHDEKPRSAPQRIQHLTVAGLLTVMVSLLTGAAFGGTTGYVLASTWVARPQSVAVQPAVDTIPLGMETISLLAIPTASPEHLTPIVTEEHTPVQAVEKVLPAVVTVVNEAGLFGIGSGSGFFISEEGYVVTNNHVVKGAKKLSIIYAHGDTAPATLVGAASQFDLAVLKVDGEVPTVAKWGDSSELPLGAAVIAIGSALGRYQNTVTAGILGGFNRDVAGLRALLQTDAAINQGNSGGPLINLHGEVIGINTLTIRGGFARAEGLNFAVNGNIAKIVSRELIERGQVESPYLGAEYQELSRGILVREVFEDTPANRAGLQARDIILTVNGRHVGERRPLITLLLEHHPGDTISLELLRDEIVFETTLILGYRT